MNPKIEEVTTSLVGIIRTRVSRVPEIIQPKNSTSDSIIYIPLLKKHLTVSFILTYASLHQRTFRISFALAGATPRIHTSCGAVVHYELILHLTVGFLLCIGAPHHIT